MIIPDYLRSGDTIGVTAPSDGVVDELDQKRFQNGKRQLLNRGYEVIFTENVFMADEKSRSSSGIERGRQFNQLVENKNVRGIISAKGGNFLNEMLPYVDFEKLKFYPKWFQGYSDNTGLTHAITTRCDIASIYGSNFGEFGMQDWHKSVHDNMEILQGTPIIQNSFEAYQEDFGERITGLEGYECNRKSSWKLDRNTSKKTMDVTLSGRLIGGCLDVMLFLQGTEFDGTKLFVEKYKNDGIIWYLETFDINEENLMMFLWQLKQIGWFQYTKGFLFGRPLFYSSCTDTPYEEAVLYALEELNVPIIFDCDFGHRGPRFTMINGVSATIHYSKGKGTLQYNL